MTDQMCLGSIKEKHAIKYLVLRASRHTRIANLQSLGACICIFGGSCWVSISCPLRTAARRLSNWDFMSLLVLSKAGKQPRYLTACGSWHSYDEMLMHLWFICFSFITIDWISEQIQETIILTNVLLS